MKHTFENDAVRIVNQIEGLCWADNWTVHKAIPLVVNALENAYRLGQMSRPEATEQQDKKENE